ncbi:MAG: MFS transporter [Acidimicrobiia bacterium]
MTDTTLATGRRVLALIAVSQLFALSLWFSATAVAPQLEAIWNLSLGEVAGLTLAVQLGFVIGALLSSVLNLPDVIPSRRLFSISAVLGAAMNLGLLAMGPDTVASALGLRFLTGLFLAGVYPSGLKVMAGWFRAGRGMALGVLVGALTVGSASPHLIRGLGFDWQGVVVAASTLTLLSALLMTRVGDGPHEVPSQRFRWSQAAIVLRNRGVRLSTYGYLGHMWELYAMWTWAAAFLAASAEAAGQSYGSTSVATFAVIAAGGPASWWAGVIADRMGRTVVAGGAMLISGLCALLTPVFFGAPPQVVVPVMMVWGAAVVADSAQFSAMVTETSADETRGTALTLQTAAGFLLTLVTIRLVPALADDLSWRWAFPVLALGPAAGVAAMARLRASSYAALIAGGRG